ncbi:MAG: MAPEG family protein [Beijerinckiaceae bacterium]|nr:MAPEG family protein [Beijerinckiaceae bacterium]
MTIQMILLPLFVHVLLVFVLLFWMGRTRFYAARSKQVKELDPAASQYAWPPRAAQAARAFENQFETPVLFYVLVILAAMTNKADLLFVVMAWLWVLSRIIHALVHTTSNRLALRFPAYLVGVLILLVMWIIFAVRILAA